MSSRPSLPTNSTRRRYRWPFILAAIGILAWLNGNSTIHGAIIRTDVKVAYALNSFVGASASIDRVIGWLNTKLGDLAVISSLGLVFVAHALMAGTIRDKLSRLAFWGWAGAIVLTAYVGIWSIEDWICRPIPLQVLTKLHNGQTMNGLHLHSSANESFPSGHALAFMLFVLMSAKRYPTMSMLLALIALVMLPIRLALGLHWLSDMALGSLALACLLTALAYETALIRIYYFARRFLRFAWKSTSNAYAFSAADRRSIQHRSQYALVTQADTGKAHPAEERVGPASTSPEASLADSSRQPVKSGG